MKYFQRGGGYYVDFGASQMTVEGRIKVKKGQEIVEVLPHGLRFADGSELRPTKSSSLPDTTTCARGLVLSWLTRL